MKRTLFFTVLLLLAISSFAQDIPNRFIFIEGTAENADHQDFFLRNFQMEAVGAGYTVTESKAEASHTVLFNVVPNTVTDSDGEEQPAPPDDNQYVIKINLVSNADDFEIISFDFFFTDLDEMYVHNRSLFQSATLYIPPFTEDDIIVIEALDNRWKNKWVYLRLSFDYPITFYLLQPDGLRGGRGLYAGDFENPDRVTPIGHEIMAMPGFTAGLEFHILNIFSIELNFQMSLGDTRKTMFYNMAAGAELKFPIKFKNTMLIPYGAFSYPLNKSEEVFTEFPLYAAGGGIQFCARGGKHGAFFVDIKYMLSFSDAVMKNPYLVYEESKQLAPNPPEIHYKRSVIGIGIGYKIGLFNRKEKTRK